jgi:6-phosphogluconolactonase (cycloisomerase 2 family)
MRLIKILRVPHIFVISLFAIVWAGPLAADAPSTATATPTYSPKAGTYTTIQKVSISDVTTAATIYYTTNGTAPTTSSTRYTAPITVSKSETIKAIAVASGLTESGVASAGYTIETPTATPVFSPKAGTYTTIQKVSISDVTTAATIYYTTNGTAPTTSSTRYTAPITVSKSETIKAIAVASGFTESGVASAGYTIETPTATPVFSPKAGTYTTGQTVSISDATVGASVFYTTNGSTPTTSSTKYTTPIAVKSSETIEAIAVAAGDTQSAVVSATYDISQRLPAPTGLTATGGNAQVTLSWNGVTGASSYNVYRSITAGSQGLKIGSSATVSYTDQSAISGTGYYYEVTAVNATGEGTASAQSVAATPVGPNMAISIVSQPTTQSVAVPNAATFSVSATGYPLPTYQWQVSTDSGVTYSNVVGATKNSYVVASPTSGNSGNLYQVVINNSLGSIISTSALLVVGISPTPTAHSVYAITSYTSYPEGYPSTQWWVSSLAVNSSTGGLSPVIGSRVPVGTAPSSLGVTPNGKFLYVSNYDDGTISGFSINPSTGVPTPIAGSPFATGQYPYHIAIHPSGDFLFVNAAPIGGTNVIQGYAINPITGVLTPLVTTPPTPGMVYGDVLFAAGGECAIATDVVNSNIYPMALNTTTGALTAASSGPVAAPGVENLALTVSPSGTNVYSSIYAGWSVNKANCGLTPISESSSWLSAEEEPGGPLAFDGSGKYAYVAGYVPNEWQMYAFSANSASGTLSPVRGSPFGFLSEDATYYTSGFVLDASGQHLYTISYNECCGTYLTGFQLNDATGAIATLAGSPFLANQLPPCAKKNNCIALGANGESLYTLSLNGQLWALSIDASNGNVTTISSAPTFAADGNAIRGFLFW